MTEPTLTAFGPALELLKAGRKATRQFWKEGLYVHYQNDDFVYFNQDSDPLPYELSAADIVAEDWHEFTG
jgi:Protein of unknown function (DUF2829)